jgi:hypothetical protein
MPAFSARPPGGSAKIFPSWTNTPANASADGVGRSITRNELIDELDRLAAKVDELPGPATHLCTWTVT